MFARSQITGVVGSQIKTRHVQQSSQAPQARMRSNELRAAVSAGGLTGNPSSATLNVGAAWPSQYQYYFTGMIPADPNINDPMSLALFYRDIYLHDNVAGSAVDIQSTFPFSDFDLRGLDKPMLKIYEDACSQLSFRELLPLISSAYLTDGFFCGTLIYNEQRKQFIDIMIHDALQCAVRTSPFGNADPAIRVTVANSVSNFLRNDSEYNQHYIDSLPENYKELLAEGAYDLNPVSTLFVPRRVMTDRPYVSFLHRILPMYMIEKTMFRGTLVEANRRQRAMTHITAGDDLWTPTGEELNALISQFMAAEYDPMGGWVATRGSVQMTDIRPGGDFWKWTDMSDILTAYKLRALGISESFLSGDASYATAESAYSLYLESMAEYRYKLTRRIFYHRLFPLVAVINGFYKDKKNVGRTRTMDFLYNQSDRDNLLMPTLHWHKSLEGKNEDDQFDMLEKASDKGVPIALKMWMSAAGIDSESLLRDLKEDDELREKLGKLTHKDTSHEGEDDTPDEGYQEEASLRGYMRPPTQSFANGARTRVPILARDFGDSEMFAFTKTGQKKYIFDQVLARERAHERIVRAHQTLQDPNERLRARKKNLDKLGQNVLTMGF